MSIWWVKRKRLSKAALIALMIIIACTAVFILRKNSEIPGSGPEIKVYFHRSKQVKAIPLEKYVIGVVLAEMPASFEIEALKAQAVCARSYALVQAYSPSDHPGRAHVCDDPNHCQAYVDPEKVSNARRVIRIERAVKATRGQVLTYRGELAVPYYHSCCGGRTASASEIWNRSVPYLTSVTCPCPDISPHRLKQFTFDVKQIADQLKIRTSSRLLKIEVAERSASGRASKIRIGSYLVTGAAFRRALNLPSTFLTITQQGSKVTVRCRGYGHGVGLCQYGANRLAQEGYSYQSILFHYYHGTELCRLAY